jgi:hypothetical protein
MTPSDQVPFFSNLADKCVAAYEVKGPVLAQSPTTLTVVLNLSVSGSEVAATPVVEPGVFAYGGWTIGVPAVVDPFIIWQPGTGSSWTTSTTNLVSGFTPPISMGYPTNGGGVTSSYTQSVPYTLSLQFTNYPATNPVESFSSPFTLISYAYAGSSGIAPTAPGAYGGSAALTSITVQSP